MSKKTRDAKKNKIRHSLNRKTFFITLLLTMGIGAAVLVAGFWLYVSGVLHQYMVNTWNQANAEAAAIDSTGYRDICDEVLSIYDSISEEERGDGTSDEYMSKFSHLIDEDYTATQEVMRGLQNRNGPMNAFIVALDAENDRMIYLIDADPGEETNCRPGTYDDYDHEVIDELINGTELDELEQRAGIDTKMQAILTNFQNYGLRCTAASTLYTTEKYVVVVCVDEKLDSVVMISMVFLVRYILLLVAVTLIASFIGMRLMRKATVIPVNKMAKAAEEYGSDADKQQDVRHFDSLDINTGDELQQLAEALSSMENELSDYMSDLTHVTAEKERMATELSLAAGIQKSMLTEEFPAFPERREFDIYASMEPAKEVGGDFYDMLLIDDDHLAVEIADVSGKGIPAALFMMSSMIMLADRIKDGLTPAETLREINDRICNENEQEMFVTVWLGILEISTGRLTAANAGHEYPVIVHRDGTAELIKDKHGFVIGGMTGMKYTDYELRLEKGDSIFVYTDGVTEATSKASELFGTERMLAAAGSAGRDAGPADIMSSVRTAISDFIGDAEQFDDLTMLCLKYIGSEE